MVTHWAWSDYGWLNIYLKEEYGEEIKYKDFAGSGVVHMVGGMMALIGAIAVGPRIGRFDTDKGIQGHTVPVSTNQKLN